MDNMHENKRTILQINTCLSGSTGCIMKMIHEKAKSEGFKAISVFGREKSQYSEDFIRIGNDFDVYKHVALTRLLDRHGKGSKKATSIFLRKLDEIKPDLIHFHNIHGYFLNIELMFSYIKSRNIPVIWTLHDCWAFTGHCAHFDFYNCQKWKTGCYKCPQKKIYPASLLFDNSANMYNLKKSLFTKINNLIIVCPSQWLANLVKQSYLCKYPVKIIENGIDINIFKPIENSNMVKTKLGIENNKFVILGIASDFRNERKGFDFFIDLSYKIDDSITIVLVGVSKKQKRKLPKNIIGLQHTKNVNELVEIYSMADVFVNPTLEDNYPTVNIEALACGTPVVAFNTGGIKEQIMPGCGYVIDKGDVNKLFNAIYKIYLEGKKKYSAKCREIAEKNHDRNSMCSKYIGIYKEIIS